MLRTMEVTKTVIKEVSITCDKCGNVYGEDDVGFGEVLRIRFSCGFESSIIGDGENVECDLCEHCVVELLGPYYRKVSNYITGEKYGNS